MACSGNRDEPHEQLLHSHEELHNQAVEVLDHHPQNATHDSPRTLPQDDEGFAQQQLDEGPPSFFHNASRVAPKISSSMGGT